MRHRAVGARLAFLPEVRASTESGAHERPWRRYPRATSRPITNLGEIARGEPRVAELLELLDLATDSQRRIYILQEVSRVYHEELEDTAAASVALRAALQEDLNHPAVLAAIGRLADDEDYWGELLAELMEDAAELGCDEPRGAADLWVRIALWYNDPVGHRGYAAEAARHALELVPDHPEALATLASLLREGEHWVDLVGVLERQAAATEGEAERIAILLSLADVADTRLGDHATAIAACRSALDTDGSCQPAFDTLRSLLHRTSATEEVAELLTQRSALIDDPDEFVELAVDIARIYGEQLGDVERAERIWRGIEDIHGAIARLGVLIDSGAGPDERAALHYRIGWFSLRGDADVGRAEWHFSQAVAEKPTHVPSRRALADIYRERRDWRKASMMLGRAAEHASDSRERVDLVVDNARILANELGDVEGAVALCEATIAAGAPSAAVARVLATLYVRLGRWNELQPLLEELEREIVGGERRPEKIGGLYHLMARTAAECGNRDRALAYYHEAHRLVPGDVDVLRGLADQYFACSRMREAARKYRALLEAGPSPQSEAAVWYRLGVALRASDDRKGALDAFLRVAKLEPDHLPAVEAAAELLVGFRHWRAAAKAKRAQLELAPPDDAQEVRIELGDLHRDKLGEPRRALALYSEAVEARPGDHVALQRRLDTATALGDWQIAIDSIERFASAETVAMRRGSYLYTAAVICRDEIGDDDAAADWLERALDAYFGAGAPSAADLPRAMKPFVALDSLHTRRRAWAEQARAYRRMIKRLPAGHPVLGDLWHALGEVYRSRLRRYREAAAAFEVARSLNPDDLERRTILAELYQLTSDSPRSAADEHHAVLARDPGRAESYRALEEIYKRARRMDQAWCACRALVFLERATPTETELYRRYRSEQLTEFKASVTPEMRRHIVHPDESGIVALALAVVRAEVAAARPSGLRLRDRQRVEPGPHEHRRLRLIAHVAAALDRPLPEVYDQTKQVGPLAFGLCRIEEDLQPVLAPRAEYLGADDTTAAFAAGRALSLLEPDRVLSVLFSEAELRSIVTWILGRPEQSAMRALLDNAVGGRMRADQKEQLQHARKALATMDWKRELDRWLRAVVITSDRTGFLVSGDLEASTRVVAGLRGSHAGLTPAARILELLRYSVTDEHASIRRHLCGRV